MMAFHPWLRLSERCGDRWIALLAWDITQHGIIVLESCQALH